MKVAFRTFKQIYDMIRSQVKITPQHCAARMPRLIHITEILTGVFGESMVSSKDGISASGYRQTKLTPIQSVGFIPQCGHV
jgi:hypothetical protein